MKELEASLATMAKEKEDAVKEKEDAVKEKEDAVRRHISRCLWLRWLAFRPQPASQAHQVVAQTWHGAARLRQLR